MAVMNRSKRSLADRRLSYVVAGSTSPGSEVWTDRPAGFRAFERRVRIGAGEDAWTTAVEALLGWGVKTRSGFRVEPEVDGASEVREDANYWLIASFGLFDIREPVRIVSTITRSDRQGFAYGTLEGHPVSGEEAFIVSRGADGTVGLTLRSLTQPPSGAWRVAYPAALVAQRVYRRRYLRSLLGPR